LWRSAAPWTRTTLEGIDFVEAMFFSTAVVALAEMGDKTQLLSFVLAAKLKRKVPIALGILFATLANHFLAGYVGTWLAGLMSPETLKWVIAASFFVFALWALKPDKLDESRHLRGAGVFLTTLFAFFMVEMGDKTQLATVLFASKPGVSLVTVFIGASLALICSSLIAVAAGSVISQYIDPRYLSYIAGAGFIIIGIWTIVQAG